MPVGTAGAVPLSTPTPDARTAGRGTAPGFRPCHANAPARYCPVRSKCGRRRGRRAAGAMRIRRRIRRPEGRTSAGARRCHAGAGSSQSGRRPGAAGVGSVRAGRRSARAARWIRRRAPVAGDAGRPYAGRRLRATADHAAPVRMRPRVLRDRRYEMSVSAIVAGDAAGSNSPRSYIWKNRSNSVLNSPAKSFVLTSRR